MSNTEETINDHDPLMMLLTTFTPYGALYELSKALFDEKNHEQLVQWRDKHLAEQTINKQIANWRSQQENPKFTRAIVKIINNTAHTFKLTNSTLGLDDSTRESLTLLPNAPIAFKRTFVYDIRVGSRSKSLFNHTMVFEDEHTGVHFEFGLYVNVSFGYLTPTLKPRRTAKTTSIGRSVINCTTEITEASDEAPFSFQVNITLD